MQRKPSGDWSTWALAFVFLGATGAALKLGAPQSARGVGETQTDAESHAPADPYRKSQPWADPFLAMPPQWEVNEAREQPLDIPDTDQVFASVAQRIRRGMPDQARVDLYVVYVEGGTEHERREDRRRQRTAIHAAASLRGFESALNDQIARGYHRWPSRLGLLVPDLTQTELTLHRHTPVTIEAFTGSDWEEENEEKVEARAAIVVWADYEHAKGNSQRFAHTLADRARAHLEKEFAGEESLRLEVGIFGPPTSDMLSDLRGEQPARVRNPAVARRPFTQDEAVRVIQASVTEDPYPRAVENELFLALIHDLDLLTDAQDQVAQARDALLSEIASNRRRGGGEAAREAAKSFALLLANDPEKVADDDHPYVQFLSKFVVPTRVREFSEESPLPPITVYSTYATASNPPVRMPIGHIGTESPIDIEPLGAPEEEDDGQEPDPAEDDPKAGWTPADEDGRWLLHFTVPDEKVIAQLVEELRNRGVSPEDTVLLVREWGSLYTSQFESALRDSNVTAHVESTFYFRGIDGLGLGMQEKADSAGRFAAFPAGRNQTDYLLRLARTVRSSEHLRNEISAVGVVGYDVYDKEMILQIMKPIVPHALFFTSDIDARMAHPSQYDWSRNLIVGSGLPLDLGLIRADKTRVPPFRDTYQTSTFLAAHTALGNLEPSALEACPHRRELAVDHPVDEATRTRLTEAMKHCGCNAGVDTLWNKKPKNQLFEVSRNGFVRLTSQDERSRSKLALLMQFGLSVLAVGLATHAVQFWRRRKQMPAHAQADGTSRAVGEESYAAIRRALTSAGLATALVLVLLLDQVAWASSGRIWGEPYSFTSGISSWPRLMWLTLACVMSFFLLLGMVTHQRHFAHAEWRRHDDWREDGEKDETAGRIATERLPGSQNSLMRLERWADSARRWRVFGISAAIATGYTLLFLFVAPTFRYYQFFRDPDLQFLSQGIQIASNFFFSWMCAYYALTLRLYIQRIRGLIEERAGGDARRSRFPSSVLLEAGYVMEAPKADPLALDVALDLELIGRTSRVVGSQILFPFLSLALVMLGLSSYFEAANFSVAWIAFHVLPIALLIGGAMLLRFECESARRKALETCDAALHELRRVKSNDEDEEKAQNAAQEQTKKVRERIARIAEGSFAPWQQRPVFKAILYPLGSGSLTWLTSILAQNAG